MHWDGIQPPYTYTYRRYKYLTVEVHMSERAKVFISFRSCPRMRDPYISMLHPNYVLLEINTV